MGPIFDSSEDSPSPTMSALSTPRGKASAAPTDVESIMPLLFATIGNLAISFRKMAAMDPNGRSESSLEHKFRKWRQMGREIAEKHPEHAAEFAAGTPKKAPAKKATNLRNEKGVDDGDDASNKTSKSATATSKGNKKRSAPDAVDNDDGEGEGLPKKAKVTKKGVAKVLKKPAVKARVSMESLTDNEDEVETPAKGKSRAKAAPKGKASATAAKHEDEEDEVADGVAVKNENVGDLEPMQFEMEMEA